MDQPSYPLETVFEMIKSGQVEIKQIPALETALYHFGWERAEIEMCLLRLKPKHFRKTKEHKSFKTKVMMDYYKAKNIMEGNDVYTHFYIHPRTGFLTISSFKEL